MDLAAFAASLTADVPPTGISSALAALWWSKRGEWDRAHGLVQDDGSADGAWVHAYLHRVEGDLGNAAYWYHRARRPVAEGATDAEWTALVMNLLKPGV